MAENKSESPLVGLWAFKDAPKEFRYSVGGDEDYVLMVSDDFGSDHERMSLISMFETDLFPHKIRTEVQDWVGRYTLVVFCHH